MIKTPARPVSARGGRSESHGPSTILYGKVYGLGPCAPKHMQHGGSSQAYLNSIDNEEKALKLTGYKRKQPGSAKQHISILEDSAAEYNSKGGLSHGTANSSRVNYKRKENTFDAEERRMEKAARTKLALQRSEYVQNILITPEPKLRNLPIKEKGVLLFRNYKLKGQDL